MKDGISCYMTEHRSLSAAVKKAWEMAERDETQHILHDMEGYTIQVTSFDYGPKQ